MTESVGKWKSGLLKKDDRSKDYKDEADASNASLRSFGFSAKDVKPEAGSAQAQRLSGNHLD
jgi:hypothetical protein